MRAHWTMLGPLLILAVLSTVGGWSGIDRFAAYLRPADGSMPEGGSRALEIFPQRPCGRLWRCWAGILPIDFYRRRPESPGQLAAKFPAGIQVFRNKFYVDEIYGSPLSGRYSQVSKYFLEWVVDVAILGGSGMAARRHGRARRRSPAALAIRQPAVVCRVARSWARRCCSCLCLRPTCLARLEWTSLGGALRDDSDEQFDSHLDSPHPARRCDACRVTARPRQATRMADAAHIAGHLWPDSASARALRSLASRDFSL